MFSYRPLVHDAPERVTKVEPDPCDARPGALIVTTQQGSRRTRYLGVTRFRCAVGDELAEAPPHRTRTVSLNWSPFGGTEDD